MFKLQTHLSEVKRSDVRNVVLVHVDLFTYQIAEPDAGIQIEDFSRMRVSSIFIHLKTLLSKGVGARYGRKNPPKLRKIQLACLRKGLEKSFQRKVPTARGTMSSQTISISEGMEARQI